MLDLLLYLGKKLYAIPASGVGAAEEEVLATNYLGTNY